jgi:hypothetical protein
VRIGSRTKEGGILGVNLACATEMLKALYGPAKRT